MFSVYAGSPHLSQGRANPNAAPAPAAPEPPKQAAIVIKGLETFDNIQPKAGAVPSKEPKPKEEFVGGLYVGDDSAKLVTDDKAGKPKSTAPILPWDMPVEDVPAEDERMLPSKGIYTAFFTSY